MKFRAIYANGQMHPDGPLGLREGTPVEGRLSRLRSTFIASAFKFRLRPIQAEALRSASISEQPNFRVLAIDVRREIARRLIEEFDSMPIRPLNDAEIASIPKAPGVYQILYARIPELVRVICTDIPAFLRMMHDTVRDGQQGPVTEYGFKCILVDAELFRRIDEEWLVRLYRERDRRSCFLNDQLEDESVGSIP